MKFRDEGTLDLPLVGGVIQAQRLIVPHEVIAGIKSYRHACRLAWKLRRTRLTQQQLGALSKVLYQSHITDYFSVHETTKQGKPRRELPAKHIAEVEHWIGNTVISQYQAYCAELTVLEEVQAERRRA